MYPTLVVECYAKPRILFTSSSSAIHVLCACCRRVTSASVAWHLERRDMKALAAAEGLRLGSSNK
jgi:hypothetical protein